MISELTVNNFKGFGSKQSARLAPITLVYGPNSGGKSSLIQSLLLLGQSLRQDDWRSISRAPFSLIPRGNFTDLGSFMSLAHGHRVRNPVSIGLSIKTDSQAELRRNPFLRSLSRAQNGASVESEVELQFTGASTPGSGSKKQDSSALRKISYAIKSLGEYFLKCDFLTDSKSSSQFKFAGHNDIEAYVDLMYETNMFSEQYLRRDFRLPPQYRRDIQDFAPPDREKILRILKTSAINGPQGLPDIIRTDESLNLFGDSIPERMEARFISEPMHLIQRVTADALEDINYLGPLRSPPERHYLATGPSVSNVGVAGEHTARILFENPGLQTVVDNWFQNFEIPYTVKVDRLVDSITGDIFSMNLEDIRSKVTVAPTDVGFGIGQLLPILVQSVANKNNGILCVEQPEIHLHPRLQAHIADLMISTTIVPENLALASERETVRRESIESGIVLNSAMQWLVETHSETLILRLLRRIREGLIRKEDVSVLYVNMDEAGESKITELQINDDGEFIDEWPDGFFDEAFDELMD